MPTPAEPHPTTLNSSSPHLPHDMQRTPNAFFLLSSWKEVLGFSVCCSDPGLPGVFSAWAACWATQNCISSWAGGQELSTTQENVENMFETTVTTGWVCLFVCFVNSFVARAKEKAESRASEQQCKHSLCWDRLLAFSSGKKLISTSIFLLEARYNQLSPNKVKQMKN